MVSLITGGSVLEGLPWGLSGKESACQGRRCRTQFPLLGGEDPLEEGMAIHSRILAWEIPWTEELGGLQAMGLQRVGYNRATRQQKTEFLGYGVLVRSMNF